MSHINDLHTAALDLADDALCARRRGDHEHAIVLFRQAFALERAATDLVHADLAAEPTRSILYWSAATLAVECQDYPEATYLVKTALAGNPPPAVANELQELVKRLRQSSAPLSEHSPMALPPGTRVAKNSSVQQRGTRTNVGTSPSRLAELVTQRRMALGLTMRSLAARIGVSSSYISHIEQGRVALPAPPVLSALARELYVGEETLLRAIGYLRPMVDIHKRVAPVTSLARLVKQVREARGWTQAQVDAAIGRSTGYTGMLENGGIRRPRQETLRKLASVLGIPQEDMLVATGNLDGPSEDTPPILQRIAAIPDRHQRLEAWARLPESLRSAVLVLMQDMVLAGAQLPHNLPAPASEVSDEPVTSA